MADPVRDAEGAELGKVSVVENEDKVAGLATETLQHVAVAAGSSWPFIAGWLVVFAIQIWCAAEYSGRKSVVATVVLTIISTVVGYFAITRVLQQKRVF